MVIIRVFPTFLGVGSLLSTYCTTYKVRVQIVMMMFYTNIIVMRVRTL